MALKFKNFIQLGAVEKHYYYFEFDRTILLI